MDNDCPFEVGDEVLCQGRDGDWYYAEVENVDWREESPASEEAQPRDAVLEVVWLSGPDVGETDHVVCSACHGT